MLGVLGVYWVHGAVACIYRRLHLWIHLTFILLRQLNQLHDFILDHFQLANFALNLILELRRIVKFFVQS